MQKKLLTLAVAGALAAPCIAMGQGSGPPAAAVEVYGTINMAFGKFKYSEGTAANTPSVSKWDVAQGASNYGLRGRESLGGGLTACEARRQNGCPTPPPASAASQVGCRAAALVFPIPGDPVRPGAFWQL